MFLKICICGNNIPDNEAIFRYLIKNLEFFSVSFILGYNDSFHKNLIKIITNDRIKF